MPILSNPSAPLDSAKTLLGASKISAMLRTYAALPLARWLAAQPECQRRITVIEPGMSEAAIRAFNDGQAIDRFRRVKAVTAKVEQCLKYLARAEEHEHGHVDQQVRHAASKALNGLRTGRMSWPQVDDALRTMRSALRTGGCRRSSRRAFQPEETIAGVAGRVWRRVTTVERLEAIGRESGLCTAPPRPQAKAYARDLKAGHKRFYELAQPTGTFLGLVSIDTDDMTVSEAKGPGNSLMTGCRSSLKNLLAATGAQVGSCQALLEIGLADGFLDIDLKRPDHEIDGMHLWRGKKGGVLLRRDGAWAVFQRVRGGSFYGQGDYDADDIIGMLINALLAL